MAMLALGLWTSRDRSCRAVSDTRATGLSGLFFKLFRFPKNLWSREVPLAVSNPDPKFLQQTRLFLATLLIDAG
jgi:hypothetical protein